VSAWWVSPSSRGLCGGSAALSGNRNPGCLTWHAPSPAQVGAAMAELAALGPLDSLSDRQNPGAATRDEGGSARESRRMEQQVCVQADPILGLGVC
jgi:hypothetical protein